MHWFWRAMAGGVFGAFATAGIVGISLVIRPNSDPIEFLLVILASFFVCSFAAFIAVHLPGVLPEEKETRCRKCGYILRGITEPRCPECGERI